ncbi:MAG: serine/threonine protein kinase, partial [Sedimentisphaerales bacterium]|nr:serine/threonine protein kinase [Sedimentisphaerales bacterium]
MHDCLSQREIAAFVEGKASAGQATAWKRHLRVCDHCAGAVVRMRAGLRPVPRTPEKGEASGHREALSGALVALEPNVQIGDFKLERRLGTGGMGVVYQALQVSLNRRVALKILPLGFGRDAAGIERFHREARAAAKLRHRNIVTVYAEGAENNVCYFAMEMFDGLNLDEVIEDLRGARAGASQAADSCAASETPEEMESSGTAAGSGRPPHLLRQCKSDHEYFPCVARLISEVAEALDYAHAEGIIHRDVKPSNLILAHDGRLVLLDFGIARVREERAMTLTDSFIGTPRYMSPEQLADGPRKLDHRSDIYSLGVTLYELLTLEPLFEGDTQQQLIGQILAKDPRRPRQVNP